MLLNNVIWSFVQNISTKVLQFVFGVILARLLTPEDFGVVAICLFFISISQTIIESGLGVALVRNNDIDERDYDTVFTFSFIISLILYLLLFMFSDLISSFYDTSIISNILKVLGIKIILGSYLITSYSKLRKERNLKLIALITVSSSILGYVFAIIAAFIGFGVWSIVIMHITTTIITLIFYLLKFKSIPKFRFYKEKFKNLFSFGGNLLLSSIINRFFNNIHSLVIGKFLNLGDVGIFQRANSLQQLPIQTINSSISGGIGPTLYKMQESKEKLNKLNRLIFELSMVLTCFVCCYIFFYSKEIIVVVLTEKWIAVEPILRLFSIAGVFFPFFTFFNTFFKALGNTKIILKLEVLSKIFFFLSLSFVFFWQLNGVVYGIIISNFIQSLLCFYLLKMNGCYSFKELIHDLKKPLLFSILLAASMLTFNYMTFMSDVAKLIFVTLVSLMIFSVLFVFYYKKELFRMLKMIKIKA